MGRVSLQGVSKAFGAVEVIKGVDLAIEDRELVVFVGPSGCGKSTLLRMIAGLEDIDYGVISIDSQDVSELAPARRGVAMVFQNYALYPHMSAYENIAYNLRRAGLSKDEVDKRVRAAAHVLQIEPLLPRLPRAMSGGQRQRVAIGRAIVRNPKVFLFDEPLSNLDAALRIEMRAQITRLHRELKATMIFVTHDQVEAMTMADRIVVLRAGVVEQVGKPLDIYRRPRNLFVAGFIGSPAIDLFPATVVASSRTVTTIRLDGMDRPVDVDAPAGRIRMGEVVTLGVRPERLRLVPAGHGSFEASVSHLEQLGGESIVHATIGAGQTIRVKALSDATVGVDDRVGVDIDVADANLFDSTGMNCQLEASARE